MEIKLIVQMPNSMSPKITIGKKVTDDNERGDTPA